MGTRQSHRCEIPATNRGSTNLGRQGRLNTEQVASQTGTSGCTSENGALPRPLLATFADDRTTQLFSMSPERQPCLPTPTAPPA